MAFHPTEGFYGCEVLVLDTEGCDVAPCRPKEHVLDRQHFLLSDVNKRQF